MQLPITKWFHKTRKIFDRTIAVVFFFVSEWSTLFDYQEIIQVLEWFQYTRVIECNATLQNVNANFFVRVTSAKEPLYMTSRQMFIAAWSNEKFSETPIGVTGARFRLGGCSQACSNNILYIQRFSRSSEKHSLNVFFSFLFNLRQYSKTCQKSWILSSYYKENSRHEFCFLVQDHSMHSFVKIFITRKYLKIHIDLVLLPQIWPGAHPGVWVPTIWITTTLRNAFNRLILWFPSLKWSRRSFIMTTGSVWRGSKRENKLGIPGGTTQVVREVVYRVISPNYPPFAPTRRSTDEIGGFFRRSFASPLKIQTQDWAKLLVWCALTHHLPTRPNSRKTIVFTTF